MLSTHRGPIHFLHISKTGGTAVKCALGPWQNSLELRLHDHAILLRDVPVGELVFFFVRHPVERFVSGFLSRQREGRPRYNVPQSEDERIAFERFLTPNALAEALSSGGEEPLHAMRSIRHLARPLSLWLESAEYLRSRAGDILLLGEQARFGQDFEALRDLLGLPASVQLPQDEVQAHRSPASSDRTLSERGRANVMHWFAQDVELYAACTELAAEIRTRRLIA